MEGPGDYHTKWCKSDRERQKWYTFMQNLKKKNYINELIYKTESLTDFENELVVTSGEKSRWGIDWEFLTDMYKLLYLK